MPENRGISPIPFGQSVPSEQSDSRDADGFLHLNPNQPDDPIRLLNELCREITDLFRRNGTPYTDTQRDALRQIGAAILKAEPNTVTAVPLAPGGGKSTLIRAFLAVLVRHFAADDPISQRIGGVIVVVESSDEAHQLADACPSSADRPLVTVVESVNDSNLRAYGCPIGEADSYETCPRRACSNYENCELAQSAYRLQESPIIILLHARFQRYLEDLGELNTWYDTQGSPHHRSLLLIDELPELFDSRKLSVQALNDAENELDKQWLAYTVKEKRDKNNVLRQWNWVVKQPFLRLMGTCQNSYVQVQLSDAGFSTDDLKNLRDTLRERFPDCSAVSIVNTILQNQIGFAVYDRSFSVIIPRLKRFDKHADVAAFLFSGTAELTPELAEVPELHTPLEETYQHLHIVVQRSGSSDISASRTGLEKGKNHAATLVWLQHTLDQRPDQQNPALVVTYKSYASSLWRALGEKYQKQVYPHTDRNGKSLSSLPYFGGMNGSNVYRKATCVICAGLNRFEPQEYLSRYLALHPQENKLLTEAGIAPASEPVMLLQDTYLAIDLIQLVFRSALRNHGANTHVTLYLFQPPNHTLELLTQYFRDCQVTELPELPEGCLEAAAQERTYCGQQTYVARLLHYLQSEWKYDTPISSSELRQQVGLSQSQFKEAKKNPIVRDFFARNVEAKGSGVNTVYIKRKNKAA